MSKNYPVLILVLILALFSFCKKEEASVPLANPLDLEAFKAKFPFKGRIIFQSNLDGDNEIYLLTEQTLRKLTDNTWDDEYPKWSIDGSQIAYTANPHGNYDIFIIDADGSNITPLTSSEDDEIEHAWFPDGKRLAYTVERRAGLRNKFTLWMIDLESNEKEEMLPDFRGSSALPNFSPAAPLMGFTGKPMIGWDVFMYDMEKREVNRLTEGGKACRPHFSPDGSKVAYVSAEADGKGDIWLMNPDGSGKTRLTKRDETYDYFPSWSPDGKYIAFCSSDQHSQKKGNWSMYLVRVSTQSVIPLFDSPGRHMFPDWR